MGFLDWIGADKWIGGGIRSGYVPFTTANARKQVSGNLGRISGGMNVRRGYFPTAEELREQKRQQAGQQASTAEDIFRRLEELQNLDRYMPDTEALRSQAMSAASAQYDPVIAALRQQMGEMESRGQRDTERLGQMYASLAGSYEGDLPRIQETYGTAQTNTAAEYQALQDKVSQTYANTAKEQEELAKRLNLEAALPDTIAEQSSDRDFFNNLAAKEAQTAKTAIGMEQRGTEEFTRSGGKIARFEGANRQASLMDKLREMLGAAQLQIGQQEAAKSAAVAKGFGDLQSGAMEAAQKRAQAEFDNYVTAIKLGKDLQGSTTSGPVKSLADIPGRAMSMGLQPTATQRLQDIFSSTLANDEVIQQGIDPTYGTSMTDEALAARLMEAGRQRGLSRAELNALQMMALEYFGRR